MRQLCIHLLWLRSVLIALEAHAALTQAIAALVSVLIAAGALLYAVRSLRTMQRQTESSIAMTTETFRPIVEALVADPLCATCDLKFVNKGNGPALNFRWRDNVLPERWMAYASNVIAPQEKGLLKAEFDWQKGIVLSYNSAANRDEILTYVTINPFSGSVANRHEFEQGAAATRPGWTLLDPKLAIPGFHPDFVAMQPLWARVEHWWRLKRGRERRL
jgi:hypothetical protein